MFSTQNYQESSKLMFGLFLEALVHILLSNISFLDILASGNNYEYNICNMLALPINSAIGNWVVRVEYVLAW